MPEFTNTIDEYGDESTFEKIVDRTLESYSDNVITSLGNYAFYHNGALESVNLPALTTVGQYAFAYCDKLKTITLPIAATINSSAFRHCKSGLSSISLPAATTIQSYAFDNDWKLTSVSLPELTTISQYCFQYTPAGIVTLPKVATCSTYSNRYEGPSGYDFTQTITIPANAFNNGYNMCHLVLRSDTLCTLSATSAFTNTPISAGKGYIYVPSDLVDQYKAASNWSVYADQIVALSQYPKSVEYGTISDSWSTIFTNEENGTYSSLYSVGDTKTVTVNGANVLMRIVGIDEDDLADGSGKAKITWISEGLVGYIWMNPTNTTTGGWKDCYAREYLSGTILPTIESAVRSNIKPVNKNYYDYGTGSVLNVTDSVWIPSYYEMSGIVASYSESSGACYTGYFASDALRVKKRGPCSTGSAGFWWLRSAGYSTHFRNVGSSGNADNSYASGTYGLVLGFCT